MTKIDEEPAAPVNKASNIFKNPKKNLYFNLFQSKNITYNMFKDPKKNNL